MMASIFVFYFPSNNQYDSLINSAEIFANSWMHTVYQM